MTSVLKILGQAAPAATTETLLYTVPTAVQVAVSSINVSNRSATPATIRVSITEEGAATSTKDYLAYDVPLAANESLALTLGLTIKYADVIRVYASTANVSFSVYGSEYSMDFPIPGYAAWYDAADGDTITSSSGELTQWNDKSGNGYNLTRLNTTGPATGSRTQNSLNVIDFDRGANDLSSSRRLRPTTWSDLSQPNVIFVVGKHDANLSWMYLFDGNSGSKRNAILGHAATYSLYAGAEIYRGTPDTSAHVYTCVFNTTAGYLRIDGSQQGATGNVGSQALGNVTLGGRYDIVAGAYDLLDGFIGEVLIYNSALTTAKITTIETYLKNKWNTP